MQTQRIMTLPDSTGAELFYSQYNSRLAPRFFTSNHGQKCWHIWAKQTLFIRLTPSPPFQCWNTLRWHCHVVTTLKRGEGVEKWKFEIEKLTRLTKQVFFKECLNCFCPWLSFPGSWEKTLGTRLEYRPLAPWEAQSFGMQHNARPWHPKGDTFFFFANFLWFYTDLFWLSLNNDFIHIILLADFDKMQYFAVDDWFSVEFDHIAGFVDLHPWAGGYS